MFRSTAFFGAILVASLLFSAFAFGVAPPTKKVEQKTANTLKVSPVRTDIEVQPGGRKVIQATVTNLSDSPVKVTPVANDFVAGDERGTPALILDETQTAPVHSLKRFMSPVAPVTIPPKDSKTIDVVITVPSDAQAGGYFGSIRFMPTDPDDGGQVNMSPSVASLILLRVPGAIVEDLKLTHFQVQREGSTGTYFKDPANLELMVRFENRGNVQTAPLGAIQVRSGKDVIYEYKFNTDNPHDMILPDSARRWEVPLKDVGAFGRFTVVSTLVYGDKNQTIEMKKSFWVVPLWALLTGIATVVVSVGVAVLVIILNIRKSKKRQRKPVFGARKQVPPPRKRFGR